MILDTPESKNFPHAGGEVIDGYPAVLATRWWRRSFIMLDTDRLSSGSRLIRAMVFTLLLLFVFRFLAPPESSEDLSLWQTLLPRITTLLS